MSAPLGLLDALRMARTAAANGEAAVIVTAVANRSEAAVQPGGRLVVLQDGTVHGSLLPTLDDVMVAEAMTCLMDGKSRTRSFCVDDQVIQRRRTGTGNLDVFFEVLLRTPHLVIVGAGHIAQPLAEIAKLLDFVVSVVDDRADYANPERFPHADTILVGPYRETLARIEIHAETYIVLVTRGHVHDQACLEQVVDSPAAYIGMIGSKRRVRTVMRHAREGGSDAVALQRVHAPVGLDIAAHTPAEIAVAIAAEIINVRRGGRARSLTETKKADV